MYQESPVASPQFLMCFLFLQDHTEGHHHHILGLACQGGHRTQSLGNLLLHMDRQAPTRRAPTHQAPTHMAPTRMAPTRMATTAR